MKSVQIWSFLWSVFSQIRTEYGYRYGVSLRILDECGKIRIRKKAAYLDTFYSVSIIDSSLEIKELNGQKYLLGKAKVLYKNEKDSRG